MEVSEFYPINTEWKSKRERCDFIYRGGKAANGANRLTGVIRANMKKLSSWIIEKQTVESLNETNSVML